MSTDGTIPINQVPKDFGELETARLQSPLKEDFPVNNFRGENLIIPGMKKVVRKNGEVDYEPAPKTRPLAMNIAMALANKLAQHKVQLDYREKVANEKDPEKKKVLMESAIPNFKGQAFDLMMSKIIVDRAGAPVKEVPSTEPTLL